MKVLFLILFSSISVLWNSREIGAIDFVFKTDDRHLNANFKQCKEQFITLTLSQNQNELLKGILNGAWKKKNKGYLGLKHPYEMRHYFRTRSGDCFSVEKFNEEQFLVTILNFEGNAFILYTRDSVINNSLSEMLKAF